MSRRNLSLPACSYSASAGLSLSGLTLALSACSAIVQPDPSRLGGVDAGLDASASDSGNVHETGLFDTGAFDTGAFDTGALDTGLDAGIDAFVPEGPDSGPVCPPSCDDDIDCTADRCDLGTCVHEPQDALCPGERCSPMLGCVPTVCSADAQCDDGDRCNGAERCVPGSSPTGCVAGRALDCNDGVSCTDDGCDPSRGCVHAGRDERCADGIDCTTDVCTGTAGPTGCEYRFDDAQCNGVCEVGGRCTLRGCTSASPRMCPDDGSSCTVERCDEALGGCTSDRLDADADGFPAANVLGTRCAGGTDCDDMRSDVRPDAAETCGNMRDDDCNPATSDVCTGPTGDVCASARPLTFTGSAGVATGTATVTLSRLSDDYTSSCGGDAGSDAVFYFDVLSTSDVRIETSGSVDTVLATATTCSDAAWASRCNDDRDPGSVTTSRIWLRNLVVPSGGVPVRVYVLVDEFRPGSTEPVTLTVTLNAPTPNTCPVGGGTRPLDISGGGTIFGALTPTLGVGTQRGTCQPLASTTPEAMFRIEEPDRALSRLEVSASGFTPDLYVRYGGCGSSPELACVRGDSSGGSGGSASLDGLTGMSSSQLFYAFIDNFPSSGGEYQLRYDP
jgi:hypothetical protein